MRFGGKAEEFLEKFRELLLQDAHSLFEAVGEGLARDADLPGNGGIAQSLLTESANFNGLRHNLAETVEDLSHIKGIGDIVSGRRDLQIRHFLLQVVKPVHLVPVIILEAGVQGTHIAGGVIRTAVAVHIAGEALGRRADAASMVLLGTAVGIDVTVVIVKLLLRTRDALLGSAEIDVVLVVIGFHLFGSFQISQSVQSRQVR